MENYNNNYGEFEDLDLNGSLEYESQFTDIPVGDYDGIIDHYEIGKCTWDNEKYNGKKMLTVYINLEVNGVETQVADNIVLTNNMKWKLSQLFVGTGQMNVGGLLPNVMKAIQEMPGLRVRFSYVEDKKRKRQDGTPYKNIGKYYEKKPAATGAGWKGGF